MRLLVLISLSCLLIVGSGCLQKQFAKQEQSPPPPETVSRVVGVVQAVQMDGTIELTLADGTPEVLIPPAGDAMKTSDVGLLIRASGERDRSTRQLRATDVEVLNAPNVYVESPSSGATVTSPLQVYGFGRVNEQQFSWRVKDTDGKTVASGTAMTHAPTAGIYGPFRLEIFLPALPGRSFTLELFQVSQKDGTDQDLVSVPLALLTDRTSDFDVFFRKSGPLPDCKEVVSVKRIMAETSAVARAALLELLKGPTSEEQAAGFVTDIPDGTELKSLVINNATAHADFGDGLRAPADPCLVSGSRAQIEETLRQFPAVEQVDITPLP